MQEDSNEEERTNLPRNYLQAASPTNTSTGLDLPNKNSLEGYFLLESLSRRRGVTRSGQSSYSLNSERDSETTSNPLTDNNSNNHNRILETRGEEALEGIAEAPAAASDTGHSSELPEELSEDEEEEEDNMSGTSPSATAASGLDSKLELLTGTFLGFDTRGPSGKALKNALVTSYEQFMDLDPAMPLAFVYPNSGSNLESLPAPAAHGMRNV
jgi:hypothetical protein